MSSEAITDYDVFVSHAHADGDAVRPLVDALVAQGLRVWFDTSTVETHESITAAVRDGVSRSKLLIAYYSATYPTRRACQWELTAAFLAAQRLEDDPCKRVLVINPERLANGEPRFDHIRPVELADAKLAMAQQPDAAFWSQEAQRIARLAADHPRALGDSGALLPRQVNHRLIDSASFVGRLDALWDVHSALSASDVVMTTGASGGDVAQITGMGGVGKSSVAEEYGLRFAAAYPGGVFWLHDTDPDRSLSGPEREAMLDAQLRAIADFLGFTGRTTAEIRGAIASVIESSGRCLWVVDGLAVGLDNDEVRLWLAPHPNARTLLTTRSGKYRLARPISLGRLTPAEGYELLTAGRALSEEDREAARGIVEDLGGHALALSVAGRALQAMSGMHSFAQYRETLADPSTDEFEFAAQLEPELPNGHDPSVATTLLRSISTLKKPGHDTLRVASLLAPAPLPKAILADIFLHADSLSAGDAMRAAALGSEQACGLSLAEPTGDDGEALSVHTLVARTVRFKEPRSKRRRALCNAAIVVLMESLTDDAASADELADVVPHALELIKNVLIWARKGVKLDPRFVTLIFCVGDYALSQCNYSTAEDLYQITLEFLTRMQRSDTAHLQLIELVKKHRAIALEALDDSAGASELLEDVMAGPGSHAPEDDYERLETRSHLIRALLRSGEVERAIELQRQDAQEMAAKHGPLSAETLRLLNYYAFLRVLFAGEAYRDEAVAEQQATLVTHARTCGELHPETLQMRHNFACSLMSIGKSAAARTLFEDVLVARLEAEDSPEIESRKTLLTMLQLALLMDEEEAEEAVGLLHRVADASRRLDGPQSPLTRAAVERLNKIHGGETEDRESPRPAKRPRPAGPRVHVSDHPIGRNDPCWCGSGVKFKRCHGS